MSKESVCRGDVGLVWFCERCSLASTNEIICSKCGDQCISKIGMTINTYRKRFFFNYKLICAQIDVYNDKEVARYHAQQDRLICSKEYTEFGEYHNYMVCMECQWTEATKKVNIYHPPKPMRTVCAKCGDNLEMQVGRLKATYQQRWWRFDKLINKEFVLKGSKED